MADQTHCSKCNGHLRGGGVWGNECGYIHIRCSGLASGRDHYAGFICQTCNLAPPCLPISLHLEMRILFLRLDILDNKYLFDPANYIQFQNLKTTFRRKTTNPLKVIGISHLQESSFFVRAVNSFNYLYRHGIIDFNDPTNKSNIKKFLLAKDFNMDLRCSYSEPSIIRNSIIRHLWSTATNLRGHFVIPPVSKLP